MDSETVTSVIPIASDADVILARQTGRALAVLLGLSGSDLTLMATAISEVGRNIVQYAGRGQIEFRQLESEGRRGLKIIARDDGPGINDIGRAMQDGYSTSGGMGLGLPGSRRLMDEFEIVSAEGKGTVITMVMWER